MLCLRGRVPTPSASRTYTTAARSVPAVSAPQALRAQCRPGQLDVQCRVMLRFQRFGRKQAPFYRLVAIDSRRHRDGKALQYLGWYNPFTKETSLDAPSIKKWLSTGSQPSETVRDLLRKAMILTKTSD